MFISQVAAGGTHSVVLTRDGHVWTWGQPWPPGDMYIPLGLNSVILF
jgi:alpha-tubulin suppressor-like RCC1 family protein